MRNSVDRNDDDHVAFFPLLSDFDLLFLRFFRPKEDEQRKASEAASEERKSSRH